MIIELSQLFFQALSQVVNLLQRRIPGKAHLNLDHHLAAASARIDRAKTVIRVEFFNETAQNMTLVFFAQRKVNQRAEVSDDQPAGNNQIVKSDDRRDRHIDDDRDLHAAVFRYQ